MNDGYLKKIARIFDYKRTCYQCNIVLSPNTVIIEKVLFLGVFQNEQMAEWVAESCPEGVAVVPGAPHWLSKPDGSDIQDLIKKYTYETIHEIKKHKTKKRITMIAESQAAPGMLWMLEEKRNIPWPTNVVLMQPLGLNPNSFKAKSGMYDIDLFKKRVRENAKYYIKNFLYDKKLVKNHLEMVKLNYKFNVKDEHYGVGLTYDSSSHLVYVSKNTRLTFVCGARDAIFPSNEILQTVNKTGVDYDMMVVSGVPHTPLYTKQGHRLLKYALMVGE